MQAQNLKRKIVLIKEKRLNKIKLEYRGSTSGSSFAESGFDLLLRDIDQFNFSDFPCFLKKPKKKLMLIVVKIKINPEKSKVITQ